MGGDRDSPVSEISTVISISGDLEPSEFTLREGDEGAGTEKDGAVVDDDDEDAVIIVVAGEEVEGDEAMVVSVVIVVAEEEVMFVVEIAAVEEDVVVVGMGVVVKVVTRLPLLLLSLAALRDLSVCFISLLR